MKYIILGDTHFDLANGNERVFDFQMRFFEQQLFPYMLENKIDTIIQVGDFTDNRTKISLNIISGLKRRFFDKLKEYNFKMIHIIGNHDIFYKDSREIYSMEIFEQAYPENIEVITNNRVITMTTVFKHTSESKTKFQFVPWITNDDEFFIDNDAEVIFGHFEIKNFQMMRGFYSTNGLDPETFKNKLVFSGHYHLNQEKGNIIYVGTPYQLDWGDFNERKGFYVFDSVTKEYEFIENSVSPRHLKCTIDTDTKTIKVDGLLGGPQEFKINKSLNLSLFKDNKIKLYAKKELALVKNLFESIQPLAYSTKLEIIKDESEMIELNEKEILKQIENHNINKQIINLVNEEDKDIVSEIIIEAKKMMEEQLI